MKSQTGLDLSIHHIQARLVEPFSYESLDRSAVELSAVGSQITKAIEFAFMRALDSEESNAA